MELTDVTVCKGLPPSDFKDFLDWVDRLKNQIPEEYWDDAVVDIDASSDDDVSYAHCNVHYTRPETAEEMRQREAEERMQARRNESYARAQYEQLKQRFEPATSGISLKKS